MISTHTWVLAVLSRLEPNICTGSVLCSDDESAGSDGASHEAAKGQQQQQPPQPTAANGNHMDEEVRVGLLTAMPACLASFACSA